MSEMCFTYNELNSVADRVHGTARDKGWWPEVDQPTSRIFLPHDDLQEKLFLVVTELAEAFEDYRSPSIDIKTIYLKGSAGSLPLDEAGGSERMLRDGLKPVGFPIEMADAYIRVLDLMRARRESIQLNTWTSLDLTGKPLPYANSKALGTLLMNITKELCSSYPNLSHVLFYIECLCRNLEIPLRQAIEIKMSYNETRSARHGGKRA